MKTKSVILTMMVVFAFLFTTETQAQNYWVQNFEVTNINDLTESQCELGLIQARKTINTGQALTYTGGATFLVGVLLYANAINDVVSSDDLDYSDEVNQGTAGALIMTAGGLATTIGIPMWIVGSNRKNALELQLRKFQTPQNNTAFGVGLCVNF